jgi:hypothetical protein
MEPYYEHITVQQTNDPISAMSLVMHEFAFAADGTACSVSIGDVLDGPEEIVGTPIVIIAVGNMQTIFRTAECVTHIDAMVFAIEQFKERHGHVPTPIERMLDLADYVLTAIETHAEQEAEERERPN